ncbi:hypothetical protein Tsubulata_043544 [Turnera subulata]|uniref:Agenet domain-containing protein n=1 Tax=Turnera subulata TaxID=218843 RepID=A0A9Q0FK06_9ROSI|nr:hypothetical protein Tsubulata_043544 [Turnera subulata]
MAPKSRAKAKTTETPSPDYLVPGAKVEIMSDDEGFRGSFYTGTVVRRASSKNPAKYLCEYDLLFADDAGTKKLREIHQMGQLRPAQPPDKNPRAFKFGDEVDAFHNDGWWEGAVTEEQADGKLAVFFRVSREQIVFGQDSLRLHREWVDGAWKPPLDEEEEGEINNEGVAISTEPEPSEALKPENGEPTIQTEITQPSEAMTPEDGEPKMQTEITRLIEAMKPEDGEPKMETKIPLPSETAEVEDGGSRKKRRKETVDPSPRDTVVEEKFPRGMRVEVTSDEEGFKGAWFVANIAEAVGNDRYLVQYENIRTEDDTDFEKEEFPTSHIRPCPPELNVVDRFKMLEEVDAWYNDAWWVGTVVKVLSSKYTVYFMDTGEELQFVHSDLRPHQDWINGNWIIPSQVCMS